MKISDDNLPPHASRPLPAAMQPARAVLPLNDGYQTCVYVYRPAGRTSLSPVVYLHGIQSHPGWFVGSASALAKAGHPVFLPVRRGSGENTADRGHAQSARQLLDDVETACRFVLERTGAERLHLLGVSWGGKLAATYAASADRGVDLATLTLVAPGIAAKVDVVLGTKLSVAMALLVSPRRQFDIPLNDPALFTSNETMREYLRGDAHRLHKATGRFLYVSYCIDGRLRRAERGAIKMPTTLLLSARDRIIDNDATEAVVKKLTGRRALVQSFEGDHTLEFEPDPSAYFEALVQAVARRGEKAHDPVE